MKKKLINALIASGLIVIYVLFADFLYVHGLIALDNIIYKIDLYLLYPSYFIVAVILGWNKGLLGDVPSYVFIIVSFLLYLAFLYFVQIIFLKIKAKR